MCSEIWPLLRHTTALTGAAFLLAGQVLAAGSTERGPTMPCPLPVAEDNALQRSKPAIRRLRAVVTPGPEAGSVETDLAEMAFVTSTRPNPRIEDVVQTTHGNDRTTLRITVVNNSRHASPGGGITLSFPEFTRRSDRARIDNVAVPEGMTLHIIPAGGQLFGRNGREQAASHLMIEVHGAWRPRQARTLEIEVSGIAAPVPVRYRSALSDNRGDYHNAPAQSGFLDQQGWPVLTCTIGSVRPVVTGNDRATVRVLDGGEQE